MNVEPQRLKAFILDAGLVTKVQFNNALKKQKKPKQKLKIFWFLKV